MKSLTRNQFTGAAGEYYVAYELARKGLHAALTSGNSLSVDVIVALPSGESSLALQVKTSRRAARRRKINEFIWKEWDVGRAKIRVETTGPQSTSQLWYALVDLQLRKKGCTEVETLSPLIYLVPSAWIRAFVKPKHRRGIFCLPQSLWPLARENWAQIREILELGDVASCRTSIPKDLLSYWTDRRSASIPRDINLCDAGTPPAAKTS